MNQTLQSPRNLIGLYSAWHLDDKAIVDPTERRPDFHVEAQIARFIVEPSDVLKLSAGMARREAFPLDGVRIEEIGTLFVDDTIATSMESLDGWFDAPATGNLDLAKRTNTRFATLGRTRFIFDQEDLAATLKRHGLPETSAADRACSAWALAPYRGPSFVEFGRRLRELASDHDLQRTKQGGQRGGFEL